MVCLLSKDIGVFQFEVEEIRVSEADGVVDIYIENTGSTNVAALLM